MSERSCIACDYSEIRILDGEDLVLECTRYPPVPVALYDEGEFVGTFEMRPEMDAEDSCGEFIPDPDFAPEPEEVESMDT